MALTIAVHGLPQGSQDLGGLKLVFGTIAFAAGYPTGGEALTPGALGFTREIFALFVDSAPLICKYDPTNDTLVAHEITATIKGGEAGTVAIGIASEAAGAALSKTTATDRAGITGIAITEVANGSDLSAYTGLRFMALGW